MCQEDPGRVAPHGLGEELRDPHRGAGDVADVDGHDRHEPVLAREQRHDERLALEMREVRRERGGREVRRVAALAVGARRDDAPAELARRGDAHRRREAEAGLAQTRDVGLTEGARAAERAQDLVRDEERRAAARAAADDQREELVIRERGRAARDETLAGTRGLRPLADGHARGISASGCRSRLFAALPPACTVQSRSSKSFAQ